MTRLVRGLLALAALAGALVGVPAALIALGGNPLPRRWSGEAIVEALLRPDDGSVLVGLVTIVGWLAWLVFAASVVVELANLARPRRPRIALPGLGGLQRWSAGLLLSVMALVAAPQLTQQGGSVTTAPAQVAPAAPTAVSTTPVTSVETTAADPAPVAPVPTGARGDASARPHTHVVRAGDDLWSLAEHYYGHGRDWRRIAEANPHVLTGGPDRLEVGWRLAIPGVDLTPAPPSTGGGSGVTHVRVRPGDTLSAIAEQHLGDSDRWPEIFHANRDQLSDPDEIPVGADLVLPRAPASPRKAAPSVQPAPDRSLAVPDVPEVEPAPTPEVVVPSAIALPTPGPIVVSAPASATPATPETPPATDLATSPAVPVGLAAVGGLLAAGLVGGLAFRRRVQLQTRPVGRRIAQPPAVLRPAEVELGRRARPLSVRTLDRATRAIAAHCHGAGLPLPPLRLAYVSDTQIELVLAAPTPDAPVCFRVEGRSWLLDQADASYLSSVPGLADAPRPWPTLVSVGADAGGRQLLVDLEGLGLLGLDDDDAGVLAAMAVELSFSPWTPDLVLTLVGDDARLPEVLGEHNVTRCDDVDGLLTRLERRAREQREHGGGEVLRQHRLDPDLADAWIPEIVLVDDGLDPVQLERLRVLTTATPRVTVAAVVRGATAVAPWRLRTDEAGLATLEGDGSDPSVAVTPQSLPAPAVDAVLALFAGTGSSATTPAPWWHAEEADPPERPPDNVTYLGRRFGSTSDEDEGRAAVQARIADHAAGTVRHPTLQLLGPVELLGAAGPPPPRAAKQCLEYCAWLLENPGTTAQAMAAALVVAEGTRRSNMSRLRTWLGSDADGQAYLPDAYTGRIRLDACVSSDWQQLQVLTVAGVNRTSSASLELALELVRGAPLADAAPSQWCWAEELRTDLISCVRDVGVELAGRALTAGDIDLARWAAARALVAAPGDELLLAARVRTEHLAGNAAETERLSLQLAHQARTLGVDLDPSTVSLLQEVMEGRIRARMA